MSSHIVLRINGTDIKKPSDFKIDRYLVTDLKRNAKALMCGDLIAKKKKFFFTYEAIKASEFNKILAILWDADNLFHTLTYTENNVVKTATVYVGSIPSSLHWAEAGQDWTWKNVTFDLIER